MLFAICVDFDPNLWQVLNWVQHWGLKMKPFQILNWTNWEAPWFFRYTFRYNFVPYKEQLQWRLVLTLQCCHTNCDLQKIWRKKIVDIIFSSKLGSICWYIYIIGGKHCDKSCSVLSKCFVTNLFHFRAMHNKSQHLQSYTDVQLGGEGTHCPCEKKKTQ